MNYRFPEGFTWGTATASYQVEGAIHEGGRTPSIWDTFCARSDTIFDGSSGENACDQYHRYPQDISLMKELGIGAYRMSIAWPRIQPAPDGTVNAEGLDHYRRVLDMLRDNGIRPVVTLYHWDLPQYLQDLGGGASARYSAAIRGIRGLSRQGFRRPSGYMDHVERTMVRGISWLWLWRSCPGNQGSCTGIGRGASPQSGAWAGRAGDPRGTRR